MRLDEWEGRSHRQWALETIYWQRVNLIWRVFNIVKHIDADRRKYANQCVIWPATLRDEQQLGSFFYFGTTLRSHVKADWRARECDAHWQARTPVTTFSVHSEQQYIQTYAGNQSQSQLTSSEAYWAEQAPAARLNRHPLTSTDIWILLCAATSLPHAAPIKEGVAASMTTMAFYWNGAAAQSTCFLKERKCASPPTPTPCGRRRKSPAQSQPHIMSLLENIWKAKIWKQKLISFGQTKHTRK